MHSHAITFYFYTYSLTVYGLPLGIILLTILLYALNKIAR